MAFIVEDGTGLTTSTSYLSVQEAEDQLILNPNTPDWDVLTNTQKENIIMWATQTLNHLVKWKGSKTDGANALAWPRLYAYDCEGFSIGIDVVPDEVKQATAILANALTSTDNDPTAFDELSLFSRIKVDVIELEMWENSSRQKIPAFLARVLCGLGRLVGVSGHRFVPIRKQ